MTLREEASRGAPDEAPRRAPPGTSPELVRTLAALVEPPRAAPAAGARALGLGELPGEADHTELFVLQLVPYASVYLGAEGMLGGEARDRVAGFWRALRRTPPAEPDHLALLLALYAELIEGEQAAATEPDRPRWRLARAALLWEHLASWLPPYLDRVIELGGPFYGEWARLLAAVVAEECRAVGAAPDLPAHLRAAPRLVDPRADGGEGFLASLLTPIASGAIVTRTDLAAWAGETGASLRLGERRFILRTLWSQAPGPLLERLRRFFDASAHRHRSWAPELLDVRGHWSGRAAATASLLADLRSEVEDRGAEPMLD